MRQSGLILILWATSLLDVSAFIGSFRRIAFTTATKSTLELESASAETGDETSATTSETEEAKKVVKRERHTLFFGNVPFDMTEDEIKTLVTEAGGDVQLLTLPRARNTGEPRGFCFVDVASPEQMDLVLDKLDGNTIRDRALRVTKYASKEELSQQKQDRKQDMKKALEGTKKLYVANLPFETTREELMAFYEQYGTVIQAYLPRNKKTGLGRGFGFVTMNEDDADRALANSNGQEFQGRPLIVNEPLPPGEKTQRRQVKLYVGNLSFYTIADTLREVFEEFGTVHDCYMPEDRSAGPGASRGFGFVTMDRDDAMRAIQELDGCEIDGRIIRVNEAQPKKMENRRGRTNDRFDDDDVSVLEESDMD